MSGIDEKGRPQRDLKNAPTSPGVASGDETQPEVERSRPEPSSRDGVANSEGPNPEQPTGAADAVETALAAALERASAAGDWQTVRTLAAELEARRRARQAPQVVDLSVERARRGR